MKSSRLFFLLILFIINCFILVWLIQDRSHVSGLTATTWNSSELQVVAVRPDSGQKPCLRSDSYNL